MVERGSRQVLIAGEPVRLRTARLRPRVPAQNAQPRLLVWQVYWINGRLTASDAWAKVHGALSRLLGRGDDGAVILLYTPDDPQGGAAQRLDAFARDHWAALQSQLETTRNGRTATAGSTISTKKRDIE